MIHFWLIITILSSFTLGSHAMDKQASESTSENAGLVDLLGNAQGISLHAKLAHDVEQYKSNKKASEQLQAQSAKSDLKEQKEKSREASMDKERAYVADVNTKLQKLYESVLLYGNEKQKSEIWKQQKEIIEKAVKTGIHPDLLLNGAKSREKPDYDNLSSDEKRAFGVSRFNKPGLKYLDWWATPLYTAIDSDDITFARFLLEHGANPNQSKAHRSEAPYIKKGDPVLLAVRSLPMLDLLLEYGAAATIRTHGFQCLKAAIDRWSPELVQKYVEHDASLDNDQKTALEDVVNTGPSEDPVEEQKKIVIIHILMEAGAALNTRVTGISIPRLVKKQIDEEETVMQEDPESIKRYLWIITGLRLRQAALMETSNNRQIRAAALVSTLSATNLIPDLIALIKHYCVPNEPTYQELEDMDDSNVPSAAQTAAAPKAETHA